MKATRDPKEAKDQREGPTKEKPHSKGPELNRSKPSSSDGLRKDSKEKGRRDRRPSPVAKKPRHHPRKDVKEPSPVRAPTPSEVGSDDELKVVYGSESE